MKLKNEKKKYIQLKAMGLGPRNGKKQQRNEKEGNRKYWDVVHMLIWRLH